MHLFSRLPWAATNHFQHPITESYQMLTVSASHTECLKNVRFFDGCYSQQEAISNLIFILELKCLNDYQKMFSPFS